MSALWHVSARKGGDDVEVDLRNGLFGSVSPDASKQRSAAVISVTVELQNWTSDQNLWWDQVARI